MYFLSFLTGFFNTSMGEFFNQDKVEEEVQKGRFFIILLKQVLSMNLGDVVKVGEEGEESSFLTVLKVDFYI